MWKLSLLITLSHLFTTVGVIGAALFSVSCTQIQRSRFPILRVLDGRKLHLFIGTALCFIFGYGASWYKEILFTRMSFVQTSGSTLLAEKAGITAFDNELSEAAAEHALEAAAYFKAAEQDFAAKHFRDAGNNYQHSIALVPTLSAYLNWGIALRYQGTLTGAETALSTGLQEAKRKGRQRFEANFLLNLGAVYTAQLKFEEGLQILVTAGNIFQNLKDRLGVANCNLSTAAILQQQGKSDAALQLYSDTLDQYKALNNTLGQAHILNNKGLIQVNQWRLEDAKRSFQQSIEYYKENDFLQGQFIPLVGLGGVYLYQGRLDDSVQTLQAALGAARQSDNRLGEAETMVNIGYVYIEQNRLDDALQILQSASELEPSHPFTQGWVHNYSARAYAEQGKLKDALEHSRQSLQIFRENKIDVGQADALINLGIIYIKQNDLEAASTSLASALDLSKKTESLVNEADALGYIGMIYSKRGDSSNGLKYLTQSRDIYFNAGAQGRNLSEFKAMIDRLKK